MLSSLPESHRGLHPPTLVILYRYIVTQLAVSLSRIRSTVVPKGFEILHARAEYLQTFTKSYVRFLFLRQDYTRR